MANELNLVVDETNFVELAMRTNSTTTGTHTELKPGLELVITPDILHATLGIADEFFELADAVDAGDTVNILEEIGDMSWFIALILKGFNYQTPTLPWREHDFGGTCEAKLLRKAVSDVVSYVKKAYAYGKMDVVGLVKLEKAVADIILLLNNLVIRLGHTPLEVRQKVIDKLVKRFGDKYTDVAADLNNRDLDAERKVLEGDS